MNSWDFLDELNAKPVTKPLNGFMVKFPADLERNDMYTEYQNQFHKMSDEMLSVWIEVAEHKLPNYRRIEEILSVINAIHAARSVQRYRNAFNDL
jgi:hypothetical protein